MGIMKRKSERWATSGEVTTVFWTKPSTDRLLTGSFPAARPVDWPTRGRGERLKEEGRTVRTRTGEAGPESELVRRTIKPFHAKSETKA